MDTPGFDPVSATGQIAGGANLIAFTTGRGSCFGAKPTPSIKLATNSSLYKKMCEDMDINCGLVIDGDKDIEEMGKIIFVLPKNLQLLQLKYSQHHIFQVFLIK